MCNFNNIWHKKDVFALVSAKGNTKNTAFYVMNTDVFRNFNIPALTIKVYFLKIFLCDIWHPPVVTSENSFKYTINICFLISMINYPGKINTEMDKR